MSHGGLLANHDSFRGETDREVPARDQSQLLLEQLCHVCEGINNINEYAIHRLGRYVLAGSLRVVLDNNMFSAFSGMRAFGVSRNRSLSLFVFLLSLVTFGVNMVCNRLLSPPYFAHFPVLGQGRGIRR